MTKYQFLDTLRTALNGKVAQELLAENMRYYEDDINTEIRKGKSEEEVLSALGDPRLIARTIVETKGGSGTYFEQSFGGGRSRSGGESVRSGGGYGENRPSLFFRLPLWVWIVILLVVVVLVLSVIFSVIAAVLPVLLPILLVVFLVKLFRDGT